MTFQEILAHVIAWLQREQRVSYRALKRQFALDDEDVAALQDELIYAKRLAADEDGRVLVWTADPGTAPPAASAPASPQDRTPLSYTPAYLAEQILASKSALEGERKQVTVLFADIKDSTELIKDLDPEAAQQLLDPAIHIMMDAVHRYEGTVNQVLGDGIMALFGAPIAHEDHALRAGYAALRMQETVKHYAAEVQRTQGVPIHIRVGLNAGEVVGAGPVQTRLQAAVARGLTRFVGRDIELDTLHKALARAGPGPGQVVALVGEAGVGKSRLVYACVHSHRTAGWRVLESASVSYGKATPYFPVIELLKRYCHVEEHDDTRTIRAKVTGQMLTLDERFQNTIPALLALLEALPDDSPFLRLLGEIAAQRQPPEVELAEAHYRQALTLVEVLSMRPLQAHCHRGLGMLYVATGEREYARATLSVAIALYRAMDMTFWLPQAEAALAQMEGQ
jgi:class 3 adenylate cyclase